jgi:chorismate synthase
MANRFGHICTLTSFGESHGPSIGAVLDGLPAGIVIDEAFIQKELDRRKPGQSAITTARKEDDKFQIISGVFEGRTTGTPIAIIIPNTNQNPGDYEQLKDIYRPGHGDFVYDKKYGIRDYKGGGRSSARVTAPWVAAGAIAKIFLQQVYKISIQSVVSSIHLLKMEDAFSHSDWDQAETNAVRCPDQQLAMQMIEAIEKAKREGDSLGGVISTRVVNCPVGFGEPVFDKLNADLAKAMFSINAVKGVEFGLGFGSSRLKGSENNDSIGQQTNHDGGITAGISNGKNIEFNVAFKPVSSIGIEQEVLSTTNELKTVSIKGRHDSCILPRAVPIIEAMTALVLADHALLNLKYVDKMTEK